MAAPSQIAIAGGGIAGLTLALALARRGLAVSVFEQTAKLEEIGAGLQVSPNAWRILAALGLEDELLKVSIAPEAVCIRSSRDGGTIARLPLGRAAEARWGAPYRVIHRADLQNMLAGAVRSAGAEIMLGARIRGFDVTGARVALELDDGDAPAFDGLIGADGLWSAVRRQITGETAPRHAGKVAWRATLPATALPQGLELHETGLWLGRDAHLVHYAVRDGSQVNAVAVTTGQWDEPGWSAPGDPAEIAERFENWPEAARALVAAPPAWHKWALADRPPIRRWGSGPVTLAGDAAHPMLPFIAQGAAMGMEDAFVLADALSEAGDIAPAFRRYEAQRHERTARVQRAARATGDIYHLGGLAGRARDLTLSVMSRERLMARWDWLYGWRG